MSIGFLGRLMKYGLVKPSKTSSDVKDDQIKEMERSFDFIFTYAGSDKLDTGAVYGTVMYYISDNLERKTWHIRHMTTIKPIGDSMHMTTVKVIIDENHPNANYEFRKLRIDLEHVLGRSEIKHYIPYIRKYGADFYDKVSVLSININLHHLFEIDTDIAIYQNQKHRDDFLNKVWNNAKVRLVMKNPALAEVVENMDHHAIATISGNQAHPDGTYAFITYRMFITVDTPFHLFLNEVTEALGEATKKYREHPYLTVYTEGNRYHATASIENI